MKQFEKVRIKPIQQLLDEGWERIAWGWIKNRAVSQSPAYREVSYYYGIEKLLGKDRTLIVQQDDGGKYVHCDGTDYHVAREAMALPEEK